MKRTGWLPNKLLHPPSPSPPPLVSKRITRSMSRRSRLRQIQERLLEVQGRLEAAKRALTHRLSDTNTTTNTPSSTLRTSPPEGGEQGACPLA